MRIAIRRVGNSKGMIIPNTMLAQVGLDTEAEVTVEDGALVVRAPTRSVRRGWAEACKALSEAGDDVLVLPNFANDVDAELTW